MTFEVVKYYLETIFNTSYSAGYQSPSEFLGCLDLMDLDRFFDKPEIDLVLMLADRPTGPEEIADRIRETDKTELKANVRSFLDRAYKRGIINRLGNFQIQGKGNYTSGQQKRTHANR
jgi:hypothetical protein